ncbi:AMP-binding protein [Microbulbifer taiwanensis]|uniref:AMP-binding protein n=1 Tax=Microbulbifer taiwanensis TaxID=986746 RepID=UPI00361DE43A
MTVNTLLCAALARLMEATGNYRSGQLRITCAVSLRRLIERTYDRSFRNYLVPSSIRLKAGQETPALLRNLHKAFGRARSDRQLGTELGRLETLLPLLRLKPLRGPARSLLNRCQGTNACYSNPGRIEEDFTSFGSDAHRTQSYVGFGCLVPPTISFCTPPPSTAACSWTWSTAARPSAISTESSPHPFSKPCDSCWTRCKTRPGDDAKMMSYAIATAVTLLFAYLLFIAARLGYFGRLSLLASWDDRVDRALEFAARRHGDRELVELAQPLAWTGEQHWSAPLILETAKKLSSCWHHLGVGEGDRVAIYKANQFDYFLFSVAALRIGAIAVPINVNVAAETAAGYMQRLGVRLLVSDGGGWQKLAALDEGQLPDCLSQVILTDTPQHAAGARVHSLAALLNEPLPAAPERRRGGEDPLYIVHTSGTTGVPKGVILKQEGIAQSLRSIVLFNPVSTRDLACFALPLNHQVSHLYLHGVLLMGVRCIVDGELSAPALVRQLRERKPSVFFGFPITYTRLLEAGVTEQPLDSVRIWGTTADASHEVQQRALIPHGSFFTRLGIPVKGSLFVDGLGSSEVGIAALLRIATPWTRHFGRRVGRRTPLGPEIKIADADGTPVAKGKSGG